MDKYTLVSDHYPIICRFGKDLRRVVEEKVPKYNFCKAKWDKFQESSRSLIGEVISEDSVDNWNTAISLMLYEAARCSITVKQAPSGIKSEPKL
jgi:hypothetical protein